MVVAMVAGSFGSGNWCVGSVRLGSWCLGRKELMDAQSFPGLLGPLSFEKDRTVRRTSVILHWKDGQAKVVQP